MNPTLILILALAVGFDAFCLVDLARAAEVRYLPKWGWVLLICIISAPFGGIVYLTIGRVR
jgi:Phospholipase_D-nuclease N-terminal